ncbi:MAG: hypothetical protein GWO78_06855 [Dehalococcoidales bacterium]|nr:hypothetical protein [Dehalococcoidales bacterium]
MGKRRKKKIYSGPNLTEKYNFQEDQVLKVCISEYSDNGIGIGYFEEIPIFVFKSILGEEIEVLVEKIYPEKIIAKIKKISKVSKYRIESKCNFFGNCTGCQWLHINYDEQLNMKKRIVQKNLINNKVFCEKIIEETIPSKKKFNYRNHGRFSIRKNNETEELGFINFLNRKWSPIDSCKIMNKNINEKMKLLSGKLSNKTQVSIRASDKTGSYLIQPKFDNVEFETGQKYYTESIFDNFFQVASPSFFQVNISQVEQIFSKLQNLKIFNENQVVVDAYCGVGTFTCLIAPYVKKIIGIEESYSAVVDAKENSKNFENINYLLGKTENVLQDTLENIDVIVLDPPRIGCDDNVIKIIEETKPKKIILISCSPENFAKDISKLIEKGIYNLSKVIPFDMFPQTHHVEILGVLDCNYE